METNSDHPQAWMLGSREGDAYWSLGSLIVLKATEENTNGSFSLIEKHSPAGQSPPLHVHQSDDEMWYIIDGTVTFEVDGERFTATAGSTVFAPHGLPHSYITEEETRYLLLVHEPGLEQLWASVGSPADSWTIPDNSEVEEQMNRVAEQMEQYGIEIVGDPLTADENSSQ